MNLHTTVHDGFGAWLRDHRERAKLGLRELARLMPASASYLSRLETGDETSPPSEEWLERWAYRVGMALVFTEPGPDMHRKNCMLGTEACWMARRIPANIIEVLTDRPEPPVLVERVTELRNVLLRLYRVHLPATAEDKMRHQVDPNGWSMVLSGTLSDAAKVLGIDRVAEAEAEANGSRGMGVEERAEYERHQAMGLVKDRDEKPHAG